MPRRVGRLPLRAALELADPNVRCECNRFSAARRAVPKAACDKGHLSKAPAQLSDALTPTMRSGGCFPSVSKSPRRLRPRAPVGRRGGVRAAGRVTPASARRCGHSSSAISDAWTSSKARARSATGLATAHRGEAGAAALPFRALQVPRWEPPDTRADTKPRLLHGAVSGGLRPRHPAVGRLCLMVEGREGRAWGAMPEPTRGAASWRTSRIPRRSARLLRTVPCWGARSS
jgi:hypothetical protein